MERLTIDEAITYHNKVAHQQIKNGLRSQNDIYGFLQCAKEHKQHVEWLEKLKDYENLEEQGRLIKLPCKMGDTVYLIDRDENNKFKVYKGKWERVSLVQASKDGLFNLRGKISYDIYDCFYDDGRIMKHEMYVGQEHMKIGEAVFLTESEAEAKLKELRGGADER